MKLQTQCYLPEPTREAVDPMLGLRDLRKGLNSILLGYLLSMGAVLAATAVVCYLIFQATGGQLSRKTAEQASTVLFALVLLLGLAGLGSLALIVRGKWLCLSSAPEQYHAKWMMFLSILCILAGPILNAGVFLVGDTQPKGPGRAAKTTSFAQLQKELDEYKDGMPELDARSYVKLAGQGIGMLSSVFFVLFLRAVAKCWGSTVRAFFTETYLVFVVLLVFGVVVLIRNPSYMIARPQLLLGLGAGWLLAGLWYIGLILSTSFAITILLARPYKLPGQVPVAPPSSSLPPLPEMTIRK